MPDQPRAEKVAYVERRWPREERSSYPTRWVQWFGWRQIVLWTPKVGLRSAIVTVRVLPRWGLLLGVMVQRDEDDEWVGSLGLGLVEIEVQGMTWVGARGAPMTDPRPWEHQ